MDRKRHKELNDAYLSGELIPGVKYHHNSQVRVTNDGASVIGWIVGVEPKNEGAIYTIEREDRGPDMEVRESNIELLNDPHI